MKESKSRRGEGSESGERIVRGRRIGLREAVELANVAAGLEVERVGVVPVTRREIAEAAGLDGGSRPPDGTPRMRCLRAAHQIPSGGRDLRKS